MNNRNKRSRVNKFEKRRKNTKAITVFLILGSILILLLLSMFIFEKKNKEPVNQAENENAAVDDSPEKEDSSKSDTDVKDSDETSNNNSESVEEVELIKEQVESTDDNVIEAYIANWEPIGTEQSEPHTTNYSDGSEDRKEIEKAIRSVTELNKDDMVSLWIGNDGQQRVIGTVSNREQTEFYRVYLNWVDDQGWRPTKVERLKENDIY